MLEIQKLKEFVAWCFEIPLASVNDTTPIIDATLNLPLHDYPIVNIIINKLHDISSRHESLDDVNDDEFVIIGGGMSKLTEMTFGLKIKPPAIEEE